MTDWSFDPCIVLGLLLAAAVCVSGLQRLAHRSQRGAPALGAMYTRTLRGSAEHHCTFRVPGTLTGNEVR
jgi:hypothetical protein